MNTSSRPLGHLPLFVASTVAVLTLAACGSDALPVAEQTATTTTATTVAGTPEPSPESGSVSGLPLGRTGSAALNSFSYSIERRMASSDNYAIIHDASGAYDGGRLQCTMETREFMDGTESVLSVVDTVLDLQNNQGWLSLGQGWVAVEAGDPVATAALSFCFQAFSVASPVERDPAHGESTTRNGVPVWHVDLAAAELQDASQPGDVLTRFEGWFAEDDLWPVAVIYELETDGRQMAEQYGMRTTDAQERGTISVVSELTDVNSPDVHVTVPSG